ncbi:hypothetical protein C8R46DRAFT_1351288 [Mycena filopes]|nr:hypothetical protein C8R46DRAFT_1351288 [Mycena filopes]
MATETKEREKEGEGKEREGRVERQRSSRDEGHRDRSREKEKERERDSERRHRRDNDDDDDRRSHRSRRDSHHGERVSRRDKDEDGRSHRSHRSRSRDTDRRRRHHSASPSRRHSTASRRPHEERPRSRSRDSKRHHSSSDHHREQDKDTAKSHEVYQPAYPPTFLHNFVAKPNSPTPSIKGSDTFDVITGEEARKFARRFVKQQAAEGAILPRALAAALPPATAAMMAKSPSATSHRSLTVSNRRSDENMDKRKLPPVVFALPRSATNAAGGAGRKVVDFYMSWRGKTKTHPLKGPSRRANFLDTEFRRVRETIDGEWRRASRAIKGAVGGGSTTSDAPLPVLIRGPRDPQPPPRLPPLLTEFAREERDGAGPPSAPPAATRSVSDPFPLPSSFPINTDMPGRPPMGSHRGSVDSLTSVTSLPLLGMVRGVPMGNRTPLRVTNPGDRMSMSSSSGSFAEVPNPKLVRGSPLRDGVAFDVPEDQGAVPTPTTHLLQLPGRAASDSSNASSSGSSRKSRNRKEGKEKEKGRVDDGKQDKILIVLLDEQDGGGVKNKGEKDDNGHDNATWHGLERRLSAPSSRKPSPPRSNHDSPWLGPLVNRSEDVTFIHSPSDHLYSDDDSDDDEDEHPFIPITAYLSQMGFLSPEAAVLGRVSPSPFGPHAALPVPSPYSSPYAVAAGQQLAASYSSPYVSPVQGAGSPYTQMQLRPPSRPQTPTSYYAGGGTPPQAPWASPGGGSGGAVYPPTNYASPAPGTYVSPAPGGYAGLAPGIYRTPEATYTTPYASPASAGFPNLATGYSSPYVPPLQATRATSGFYYS